MPFLLPLVVGGPQQPSPERTTIRAEATEVLLDVVVSDKKNRLIIALNSEDFTVYEDGVRQEIRSFRAYTGATEAVGDLSPGPTTDEQGSEAGGPPQTPVRAAPNLTILLLDYSSTQFENIKLVREASIKYVEEKLRPNDLLAVFVLGSRLRFLTDFTNDREQLIAALGTSDLTGSGLAADRSSLEAGIATGSAAQMQLATTQAPAAPSGSGAAAAAGGMGAGRGSQGAAFMAERISALHFALKSAVDQRQGRNVLTAIRAIALGVKGIEARKSLVLFSEGFVVGSDLEDELHSVVDVANRSQLAVYSVESKGLETRALSGDLVQLDELTRTVGEPGSGKYAVGGESGFDRVRQVGRDMRESALRYVSNATGGFLIRNTNDLGVGLERIDAEMRSYYLLSYRPTNRKFDGKFREIRVEVNRPGLNVRARRGYYAIPPGFEYLTPEEYRLLMQARNAAPKEELPLFLRAGAFQDAGQQYRVPLILEIPTKAIKFEKKQGRLTANLQLMGLVRTGAGEFVRRFGGPLNLHATQAEYDMLEPGSVSFLNTLELPPGIYSFEVMVRDLSSGKSSRRQQGLFLREPEPGLALSVVLLSKEVDKTAAGASGFLAVGEAKIMPSARCVFRNGENMVFYFDIYNPQLDAKRKKTDLEVGLGLMRDGQPVRVRLPSYQLKEPVAQPHAHVTFSKYLELAGLAPGNYSLVFEVRDKVANETQRAQTTFSVVN
ncbi:MAG: VWA domain-containing protein [Acidobacteria bacterium]|nr:VWA domain-containing protein [Acidobacteriota bacterium]